MHTIVPIGDQWGVCWMSTHDSHDILKVSNPMTAATLASWLNGGERPAMTEMIEFIRATKPAVAVDAGS